MRVLKLGMMTACLIGMAASGAIAQSGVVEEEPLFFDVTFGPQLAAFIPLGTPGAAGLLGFEATKYVAWPLYLGAAAYGGALFRGAGTGFLGYGGLKGGLLVRLPWFSIEPGVLVGGIYSASQLAPGAGPAVLPDLTLHFDLTERFSLRVGAGYLFSPSAPLFSGPTAKVGMTF